MMRMFCCICALAAASGCAISSYPPAKPATPPEYRNAKSGFPIGASLSDADAEEMTSIVRQHTQQPILGIFAQEDGRATVDTGTENSSGTTFEFLRNNGKWLLLKQWNWIS